VPFANVNSRDKHFQRHGQAVGAIDAAEYERMADAFMFGAMNADTRECRRANLDYVRLDFVSEHFGVCALPRLVRTFYPAGPFRVSAQDFFNFECRRVDL
jgi:hypothetical protein